jgi:SAM-dependent methyltransferase
VPHEVQDKMHYKATMQVFQNAALYTQGYYDARPGKRLKHSIWQQRVRRIVWSLLDAHLQRDPAVTRVIDVGCGRGDISIEMARRYPWLKEVWGADFSHEMLAIAWAEAKPLKNVFFSEAEILRMPFADNSFDGTLSINMLHHICAADLKHALGELARITGRWLILEIKNRRSPYYRNIHSRYVHPVGHIRIFPTSTAEVTAVLRIHGFQLAVERGIFGIKWLSPIHILCYDKSR